MEKEDPKNGKDGKGRDDTDKQQENDSPVECPDGLCQKKIKFVEMENHIREAHPDAIWESQDPGQTLGRIWYIRSGQDFKSASNNWVLNLWKHDGYTFIARFRKMLGLWYSWVYIIGGITDANQYVCQITTESPDGLEDCSLIYMGKVHSIEESESQIIKKSNCLVMTNEVVQNHVTSVMRISMYKQGYDVRIGMNYSIEQVGNN